MRPTAQQAAQFAEQVTATTLKAVALGTPDALDALVTNLDKAFRATFAVVPSSRIALAKSINADGADPIAKNDDQQIVWGWAQVATVDGEELVDLQGDVISIDELQKAAHDFATNARVGKAMHEGEQVGRIVESIVFTKALQDALGIDLGMEGWFVGYQVESTEVWKRVQSGELRAFSVGGQAMSTEEAA